MARYSHISVAIPMLAEQQNLLPLLERFRQQTFQHFTLYICINNVEGGYGFEENQICLQELKSVTDLPLNIIDRSSIGCGWSGKKKGVGWARKVLFEQIMTEKDDDELVVSLDADTDFANNYLEALIATFNADTGANAMAVPYYHPLNGNAQLDRPMLRYECYMRHYLLNLFRIQSPYAFTALGSAMAFPLWAYRRIGGITPLQGGEDFYLLQKFAKTGKLINCMAPAYDNDSTVVRPQGRTSPRVPFGTGPAIAKGIAGMDESYPFYSHTGFDAVLATYQSFDHLYEKDEETPMSEFLRKQLATDDLWGSLRLNFKTKDRFIHACSERVDGLRILQFLKNTPEYRLSTAELPVDFVHDNIDTLNNYRDQLFAEEMRQRRSKH